MTNRPVALLGPQFHAPTVGAVLHDLGVSGPVATITAGWQEREDEDGQLMAQLAGRGVRLHLHGRGEHVWAEDPELQAEHRAMQNDLRMLRGLYNRQLEPAGQAWLDLLELDRPEHLIAPERAAALAAIQRLDAHLLARIERVRADFDTRTRLLQRPAVARQRSELARQLRGVDAVVIEGGHVAVILNRIALFGLAELMADKVLVGCSAGAMALCRRVVLYNDQPAIGRGHAEVALPGLGFAPGVVALPSATERLRTDDPGRMLRLSRRLAPERCVLLDEGARLVWDGTAWSGGGARGVLDDGTVHDWDRAA